jgi:hypothetical protein
VNEAQTGANYAVNAVSKDAQAGTTLATLRSVIDPDTQPAFRSYSYALVNADGSAYMGNEFSIDAGGNVKVGAGGLRDVLGSTVVPVHVKIMDQSNAAFTVTKQIDLTINPINHGPTDITLTNTSIRELSAAGDFVGAWALPTRMLARRSPTSSSTPPAAASRSSTDTTLWSTTASCSISSRRPRTGSRSR